MIITRSDRSIAPRVRKSAESHVWVLVGDLCTLAAARTDKVQHFGNDRRSGCKKSNRKTTAGLYAPLRTGDAQSFARHTVSFAAFNSFE
jgi:hypothetical protein